MIAERVRGWKVFEWIGTPSLARQASRGDAAWARRLTNLARRLLARRAALIGAEIEVICAGCDSECNWLPVKELHILTVRDISALLLIFFASVGWQGG